MGYSVQRDVMVAMRDGVQLATDLYVPDGDAPAPAIVQRLPYGKTLRVTSEEISRSLDAGYALVLQDTRGRFASEGVFDPFHEEADDGVDTLAWVAQQPWCDGQTAMAGGSYVGVTQWLAAAQAPPSLRAFVPRATGGLAGAYHDGWAYRGGALELGFVLHWAVTFLALADVARRVAAGSATSDDVDALIDASDGLDDLYRVTPLRDLGLVRGFAPYYRDWLAHPDLDEWWRALAPAEPYSVISAPSLNIGGWYDIFLTGTLTNYRGVRDAGKGEGADGARLIIGPWGHGMTGGAFPERDFGLRGSEAASDIIGSQLRFFDQHLKRRDTAGPRVELFVMGVDRWRAEEDWPPPGTQLIPYYLHSHGHANTAAGDGRLSPSAPASEPSDAYVYDPHDPVPTVGGATFLPGLAVGANAGPRDQRAVERREDILCFTTDPLAADLEVIGPVKVVLYAASSALDTDFTAKLVDVHPDGRAILLTDGILRARYRESLSHPRPLEPDRPCELVIDVGATANVFFAGHRIRLEVSSSNFPRFDRNTNSGGVIAAETEADFVPARNRVFHDAACPSHVVLPVSAPRL